MKIYHYMAYIPERDFGMTEDELVRYSSTYEPRSLVLAMLRDQLGWEVSIHVLSGSGNRCCKIQPLEIPIFFYKQLGSIFLPIMEKIPWLYHRRQRLMFSPSFDSQIRRHPPDIFVFRGNMVSLFTHHLARYLKKNHIPYVFEHHGAGVVLSQCCRDFVLGASKIIVVRDGARRAFIDGYGVSSDRISVISNGVATDQFIPTPEGELNKNAELRMIFVGRLSHAKGFDLALAGLVAVRRRFPKATLLVAGVPVPGDEYYVERHLNSLEEEDRNHVKLLGWLGKDALIELYQTADALIFPSRSMNEAEGEAEPRVVLEAMSCGVPAIAIDGSGGHCDIIKNSEIGVLAKNGDDFGDVLAQYLSDADKVASDRYRARDYILRNHSIDIIFQRYRDLCLSIMEERNRSL